MLKTNRYNTYFLSFLITSLSFTYSSGQGLRNLVAGKPAATSIETYVKKLRADVLELSSDKMEGRKLGTKGYLASVAFVEKRMTEIGLEKYAKTGFRLPFKYSVGKEFTPESKIYINNRAFFIPKDAFPVSFGDGGDNTSYLIPNSVEAFAGWLLPLYQNASEANNPNFNWEQAAYDMALNAQDRGATALYLYDNYGKQSLQTKSKFTPPQDITIPIWIINKHVYDEHIKDVNYIIPITSTARFKKEYQDGYNIIGNINNGAAATVVILAELDHLGKMENGDVFSGANDNASGVAALLQLAEMLKAAPYKQYNYAFAVFSGKEIDHAGAKSFLSIPAIGEKIAYVIDLNSIGTLSEKKVFVKGDYTAVVLKNALKAVKTDLLPTSTNSSIPKSSIDIFIKDSIPALSLSTGDFDGYRTINDKIGIINFTGLYNITKLTYDLIGALNAMKRPKFDVESHMENEQNIASLTDDLGISFDINYKGAIGAKVQEVKQGGKAANAGIERGDLIIQIGSFPVISAKSYFVVSKKYKPGEKAYFKVKKHNGKDQSINIQF